MIQTLELLGIAKDQIRLQSRHRTDEGLVSYMLSREGEKLDMMNKLIKNICENKDDKDPGFMSAKEDIIYNLF